LQKYHQVLRHHENMLHKQMEPLDKDTNREVKEIAAMDGELEAAHQKTQDQNNLITEMQQTLQTVIEQKRRQARRLTAAWSYFKQMMYDLYDLMQHFHAKDQLKALFTGFHNKYMKTEKVEDKRQRQY
jgi:citrate synthase